MKRMFIFCAAGIFLLASVVYAFADIARPKSSPSPAPGKVVTQTFLTIVADPDASEARLQISQNDLPRLREALAGVSTDPTLIQRLSRSSTRTVMAGLFLFLSVSFAGVWLARSGQRRSHKALAAVLLGAAVIGAATLVTRANAGPPTPGYVRWAKLPKALMKGQETDGSVQIEIMPEGYGMRLILPLRNAQKANGEE